MASHQNLPFRHSGAIDRLLPADCSCPQMESIAIHRYRVCRTVKNSGILPHNYSMLQNLSREDSTAANEQPHKIAIPAMDHQLVNRMCHDTRYDLLHRENSCQRMLLYHLKRI